MAGDQNLEVSLIINADTGKLEVVGSKMQDVAKRAADAKGSFLGLTGEAQKLAKALGDVVTAGALIKFLADAVKGAEEQNQAMRNLKFTVESTGGSWEKHEKQIDNWSKAIGRATKFSDGEALQSLDRLTRATGNVTQAQQASMLAMGLAAKTGKQLGETTDFVNNLINKNQRAVMEAHREYGTFVGNAKSAQEILDVLNGKFSDAALKEEGLTKSSHSLTNSFGQFKDVVGNAIIPVLATIFDTLTGLINKWESFASVISASVLKAGAAISGFNEVLGKLRNLDLEGAKAAYRDMQREISYINEAAAAQHAELEQKKTQATIAHTNVRIEATRVETNEEARAREELHQKVQQFEAESAQKIAAIGIDTLQKKNAMLNAEMTARRNKINTEIKDEAAKHKLLEKLDAEKYQRSAALNKAETQLELTKTLDVIDLNVQTLGILNSLGEGHSKAEVNRAKAILALEKSIAIARAIAAAMAAPPGIGQALAAAQVAFVVAQFAQQYQAIDKAQASFNSGNQAVSVSTELTGGQTLTETSGNLGGGVVPLGAPSGVSGSGGGGSAASNGGGGATINVGGVVINFSVEKLGMDNLKEVMLQLTEAVRRGTSEGVQLARVLQVTADKNSNLAV
jgi:hypothetical protein